MGQLYLFSTKYKAQKKMSAVESHSINYILYLSVNRFHDISFLFSRLLVGLYIYFLLRDMIRSSCTPKNSVSNRVCESTLPHLSTSKIPSGNQTLNWNSGLKWSRRVLVLLVQILEVPIKTKIYGIQRYYFYSFLAKFRSTLWKKLGRKITSKYVEYLNDKTGY